MIEKYLKCPGCEQEIYECFQWQDVFGCSSGLEFNEEHCSFFVINDKTGEFIVPYYGK